MTTIKDELKKLAEKFELQKNSVLTEAQTRQSFIMPFISNVLGFDTSDIGQVELELNAGPGSKKDEKVDIALKKDGQLLVIIEAKHLDKKLDDHINQLIGYFTFTKAKFGILTNGHNYRFYTDTEAPNMMDNQPFLEFDIDTISKEQLNELENFKFEKINVDTIFDRAERLRTENVVKKSIKEELRNPSREFINLFLKKINDGKRLTERIQIQYGEIIKESATKIIQEEVKSQLERMQNKLLSENDNSASETKDANVETTQKEMELYYIVKAITGSVVNSNDIIYKDTKDYFAVQYVNQRQTFLRYYQSKDKIILKSSGDIFEEKSIVIENPNELYNFMEDIIQYVLTFKK